MHRRCYDGPFLEKGLKNGFLKAENNEVITINSWNEWTEGSYLEPEREYSYQYLEAIKNTYKSK